MNNSNYEIISAAPRSGTNLRLCCRFSPLWWDETALLLWHHSIALQIQSFQKYFILYMEIKSSGKFSSAHCCEVSDLVARSVANGSAAFKINGVFHRWWYWYLITWHQRNETFQHLIRNETTKFLILLHFFWDSALSLARLTPQDIDIRHVYLVFTGRWQCASNAILQSLSFTRHTRAYII